MAQRAGSGHPFLALVGATTLMVLAAGSAAANGQQDRLNEIERALAKDQARMLALEEKSAALQAEISALRIEMIETADQTQNLEQSLSDSEAKLARLEQDRSVMQHQLARGRSQLAGTLAALQKIALRPPDTLIVAPGAPIDAARSALLLSYAVPVLESRAASLQDELAGLEEVREKIAREHEILRGGRAALDLERDRLARLIARKRDLEATTQAQRQAAQERGAALAAQASSLRDLLDKIEREAAVRRQEARQAQAQARREARTEAEPQEREQTAALPSAVPNDRPSHVRPFPASAASAQLVMPARGQLTRSFGQPDDSLEGLSKGLSIATRPTAQVVAPYDGQVAYAGRFRGYGQILIIEHGGRYHTLLAGLERVDAVEGQWVLAGEPVGIMGAPDAGRPVLYLELRRTGQPINPLPWFADSNNKVQG